VVVELLPVQSVSFTYSAWCHLPEQGRLKGDRCESLNLHRSHLDICCFFRFTHGVWLRLPDDVSKLFFRSIFKGLFNYS
jgi:hypothetical protein